MPLKVKQNAQAHRMGVFQLKRVIAQQNRKKAPAKVARAFPNLAKP
jgi:hypothetical protein